MSANRGLLVAGGMVGVAVLAAAAMPARAATRSATSSGGTGAAAVPERVQMWTGSELGAMMLSPVPRWAAVLAERERQAEAKARAEAEAEARAKAEAEARAKAKAKADQDRRRREQLEQLRDGMLDEWRRSSEAFGKALADGDDVGDAFAGTLDGMFGWGGSGGSDDGGSDA